MQFKTIIMHNDDVKEKKWQPKQLVDWLMDADIHIILSHIHQGFKNWNCSEILNELRNLAHYHMMWTMQSRRHRWNLRKCRDLHFPVK